MDLQLHDGYTMPPRRQFSNAKQIFLAAQGTPTYFQYLDEYGLTGLEEDNSLAAGFMDFIQSYKDIKAATAPGAIPQSNQSTKQQLVNIGKQAAGAYIGQMGPGDTSGESAKAAAEAVVGIIPGGSALMKLIDPIGAAISGPPKKIETVEQAKKVISDIDKFASRFGGFNVSDLNRLKGNIMASVPIQTQQLPVVVATPTAYPMVGGTAASLGKPVTPGFAPTPEKPATFAGMDTKTLLLLGLGGILAYKFLLKK